MNKISGSVAVVGFGTLGRAAVFHCLISGYETWACDKDTAILEGNKSVISQWLLEWVQHGKITSNDAKGALKKLHLTGRIAEAVSDAGIAIESVPEILALKRKVLAQMDQAAPADTILTSSTSAIPCSRLADATSRPDKVINMHFVSLPGFPGVDLMWGPGTSKDTIKKANQFITSIGKFSVLNRKEVFGYGFPRVWRAVKKESLEMVDRGIVSFEDIDRYWMHLLGADIGIFGILDLTGLDTILDIEREYYRETGKKEDKPPGILEAMVARGKLGAKTGEGFYSYPNPSYKKDDWLYKRGQWEEDIEEILSIRQIEGDSV